MKPRATVCPVSLVDVHIFDPTFLSGRDFYIERNVWIFKYLFFLNSVVYLMVLEVEKNLALRNT